jgi:hypothetical protein
MEPSSAEVGAGAAAPEPLGGWAAMEAAGVARRSDMGSAPVAAGFLQAPGRCRMAPLLVMLCRWWSGRCFVGGRLVMFVFISARCS